MQTHEAAEILARMVRAARKNPHTRKQKIKALEIAIECIVGEMHPEDAKAIRALAQMAD